MNSLWSDGFFIIRRGVWVNAQDPRSRAMRRRRHLCQTQNPPGIVLGRSLIPVLPAHEHLDDQGRHMLRGFGQQLLGHLLALPRLVAVQGLVHKRLSGGFPRFVGGFIEGSDLFGVKCVAVDADVVEAAAPGPFGAVRVPPDPQVETVGRNGSGYGGRDVAPAVVALFVGGVIRRGFERDVLRMSKGAGGIHGAGQADVG